MSATSGQPDPNQAMTRSPVRQRSARRRWTFRMLAVACGLLPFLILEFALRLGGVGHDLRLVIPVASAPGWAKFNPRFDEAFYGAVNLSGPEARPFRLPKPRGVIRVVVVGGSTVIGFPYPPDLAFPRFLEVLLQQNATAGTTFEVLNAGITALNSSSEAVVVEESLACEPDLMVVYTGHNEFYGPNGAAAAGSFSPESFRALARWNRIRLVQFARRLTARGGDRAEGANLLERFATDVRIPLDGEIFKEASRRFERNLEAMVAATKARSVPLLIVGPACNEQHQPPIEPPPASSHAAGEPEWHETFRNAELHVVRDEPQAALPMLDAIASGTRSTHVQFRRAEMRLQVDQPAAALFREARDLDGGRFRAPSEFTAIAQRVAARHPAKIVRFLDLQEVLQIGEPKHILGRRLFLEHVHFTYEGNVAVALALAHALVKQFAVPSRVADPTAAARSLEDVLKPQPEDHAAAHLLTTMVYSTPPFRDGLDAALCTRRQTAAALALVESLPAPRRTLFDQVTPGEMSDDNLAALIGHARAENLTEEVGRLLEIKHRRRPWDPLTRREYAAWLSGGGKPVAAQAVLRTSEDWPISNEP